MSAPWPEGSVEELRRRLYEAEETLRAIRDGEADAVVTRGVEDDQVHPLGSGEESYRAIMEAMDIGAVALDADRSVLYANAAFCDLMNCPEEILRRQGLFPSLDPTATEVVRALLEDTGSAHRRGQFVHLGPDGGVRHNPRQIVVTVAPLPLAFCSGSVLTFTDVTARLEAERASEAARIARAVISSANEAVIVCDRAGMIVNANAAALSLAEGEPLGRRFEAAYPLRFGMASGVLHADDLVSMATEGNAVQGLEGQAAKGEKTVDLLISAAPLRLAPGKISGCVVTLVDNSERKAIEKRQALLLRELDHRVKNTLAMVMSIASRTSANVDDLADFRTRFNSRLQALAATHILLADAAWSGLMLSSVVSRELAPFTTSAGPRLIVSGLDREVTPDVAIAFGLVIHELTTNAVKYGALSEAGGVVTITGREAGENVIAVTWAESGGPPVAPPARQGFGQTLITRSLKRGNVGGVTVDFAPTGVTCEMVFPV